MQNINLIYDIINQNVNEKQQNWLEEKATNFGTIHFSFVATPRFVGKQKLKSETLTDSSIIFQNWTIDRLVRVYFLLILEKNNTVEAFSKHMEMLFETAEVNESVALFSAFPYFHNPQLFIQKATDAVRSNIGDIFDSIAFENSFPAEYFNELAWNQLVLKCIFNDKPIHRIVGLEKRANQNLADTLSDFAHERWAAGRSVPAQVWQLVVNYINEAIIEDLESLFKSYIEINNIAAALVCQQSNNQKVKNLATKYDIKTKAISIEKLSWVYLQNKA